MTGAGSLSPSPQPATEIPAELSLFGAPVRSIAAVCSAAPSLLYGLGRIDRFNLGKLVARRA